MQDLFERQLADTRTEGDVIAVVLDFVSTLRPQDLGVLPEDCRPGKVRDSEDVADLALALARARISGEGPQPVLTKIEVFFARACARISRLEHMRSATGSAISA